MRVDPDRARSPERTSRQTPMTVPLPSAAFEEARQDFMQGLTHLAARRFADAEAHFAASLRLVPGRVSTLINLAAARLELGRADAALDAVSQVLAIEPDNAEAWFHRGNAEALRRRPDEALRGFERAGTLAPGFAQPWFRHGQVLQDLGRDAQALPSYERAVAADPTFAPAWTNLGTLLREQGRASEAAQAFRQARSHGADDELHDYYLAAVGDGATPAIAPALYVETLFDDYADTFAGHVVEVLDYRAHDILARSVETVAPGRTFARALDLGCGTGLCGALLRPKVRHLSGVDLSGRMLAQAEATGAYDLLARQDIVEFLRAAPSTFDLVTAADVFIYVGDLSPAFDALRRVLEPGGVFAFSVELAASAAAAFELLPSLRYAHGEDCLRERARAHGFEVLHAERGVVRRDQRRPIEGLFMVLTPGGPSPAGGATPASAAGRS